MNDRAYYDSDSARGLADYGFGNPRIEAAVRHALSWLPSTARRILDIGCGIGWSSWEMKRFIPKARVLGVDLSPKRIELAKTLFTSPGLEFEARNIADLPEDEPFDAIVMLDVYEHIPRDKRQELHRVLKQRSSTNAIFIFSCPTVSHQEYLRKFDPKSLQPVDEDVTPADLQVAAAELDGALAYVKNIKIWRNADYFHAVIRRGAPEGNADGLRNIRPSLIKLEPQRRRYDHVSAAIGYRVTRAGILLPNESGPTVCVIQPDGSAYTETFIKNHIERMPAKMTMLYGFPFPRRCDDETRLLPLPLLVAEMARRTLPERLNSVADRMKSMRLVSYLKRNCIEAVLAEYGTTGAAVAESCERAEVPLIVHFHGFDAHDRHTLYEYGPAYRRMFAVADGLVAVSRTMKQQLIGLGAPVEKIHHIPCGVDTTLFAMGNPAAAPQLFVSVGRFVDKKAPHLTLTAFSRIAERVPRARLIMIGDGPLLATTKELARTLHIHDRVQFVGPRRHDEVAATLRSARALIQHSVTTSSGDSEGTPVSILEAGAAGLPVIATRHAGIADVVIEGETGLLSDEGDVDSMAEHLIRLAEDPNFAGVLGARARSHVATCFSLEETMKRLWAVVEGAIQNRKMAKSAYGG